MQGKIQMVKYQLNENINGMKNPNAKHINFSWLRGKIIYRGRADARIIPGNLDMILRCGINFLIGEWKRPNEQMPEGQRLSLMHIARKDDFRVLVIQGFSYRDELSLEEMIHVDEFWEMDSKGNLTKAGDDCYDLLNWINQWYMNVESSWGAKYSTPEIDYKGESLK